MVRDGNIGLCSLGKTLDFDSASLRPGVQMGTSKFHAGGNSVMD